MEKTYLAVDLKSFYASVECADRGLDPLETNLVVADPSRTEKTICLAVSPSLKALGIPARPRLFQVLAGVREINLRRKKLNRQKNFTGKSSAAPELEKDPGLELDFITATPRMARYMQVSTRIYGIYLKYVSPEDIHVYSIDEVFIDLTGYLRSGKISARDMALQMIRDVLAETGITAAAGIGTNLFLCKIAMDIKAKHMPADRDGVRIAELDEMSFRKEFWDYSPLTDFWRIGRGTASRLESRGMFTLGDVARCSVKNEDLLYGLFGINAELLIDHAWGRETCTMADIKSYRPLNTSLSSGQVLQQPCSFDQALLAVTEMAEQLAMDLVRKGLCTDRIVLMAGYDRSCFRNLKDGKIPAVRGSVSLGTYTSSAKLIMDRTGKLFREKADPNLLFRRLYLSAAVKQEAPAVKAGMQLQLFPEGSETSDRKEKETAEKERRLQKAALAVHSRFGKTSLFRGMDLEPGATTLMRHRQIGGHRA